VQACAFARVLLLLLRCSITASLLSCRSACKRSLQQHNARQREQWAAYFIHLHIWPAALHQMQTHRMGTACQAGLGRMRHGTQVRLIRHADSYLLLLRSSAPIANGASSARCKTG
jgi:hypothetical protein